MTSTEVKAARDALLQEVAELLREGKDEETKRVIQKSERDFPGWNVLAARDESGRGVVHYAAIGGVLPLLQLALRAEDANVDEKDDTGWTPLMIASSAGHYECCQWLLGNAANPNAKNSTGQTPLHYAASKNRRQIVRLLIEHQSDVNASDKYGATPLHRAASQGHHEVLALLLNAPKVRIDAPDGEGNSPLFLACEEGREDAAILLASKGANLERENKEKATPLSVVQSSDLVAKLKHAAEKAH